MRYSDEEAAALRRDFALSAILLVMSSRRVVSLVPDRRGWGVGNYRLVLARAEPFRTGRCNRRPRVACLGSAFEVLIGDKAALGAVVTGKRLVTKADQKIIELKIATLIKLVLSQLSLDPPIRFSCERIVGSVVSPRVA